MIIALSGPMGVGKSTAFQALKDIGGNYCHLIKFAQPLYDAQEFLYKRISTVYARPEDFVKDRKLLQWIGTEWGRDTISKTLWVDIWKEAAAKYEPDAIVVCDDCRFDNEAEAVHSLGGLVVQLKGPSRRADDGIVAHKSEAGISPLLVDEIITNNGDLDSLKASIAHFYYNSK